MDRRQSGFTLIELMIKPSSVIKLSTHKYFMENKRLYETSGETGLFPPEHCTSAHAHLTSIRSTLIPGTISIAYKGAVESSQA